MPRPERISATFHFDTMNQKSSPPITGLRLFLAAQCIATLFGLWAHAKHGWLRGSLPQGILIAAAGHALLGAASFLPIRSRQGRSISVTGVLILSAGLNLWLHHGFIDLGADPRWSGSQEGTWNLYLFLFVPILLLAWNTGVRHVLAFVAASAVLDLVIALSLRAGAAPLAATLWRTLALALSGTAVAFLLRHLKRANHALRNQASTIAQLSESRERARISRELHDTLAHSLTAIAIQLEAADSVWDAHPGQARTLVREALATTREGALESRNAIQNLRATALTSLGLAQAIRECAQAASRRAECSVESAIEEEVNSCPEDVAQCVFRIAQEALENIARHAQARTIRIALARHRNGIRLEVSDDGIGFDLASRAQGRFGLEGMRERSEWIEADLRIVSSPGHGTRISLAWENPA